MLLNKHKPLIVELYGLPGSGKSTLARKIVDSQPKTASLIRILSRRERIQYGAWFCATYPRVAWKLALVYVENFQYGLVRHKFSVLSYSIAAYMKAFSCAYPIALLDEGMFQRILSLYKHSVAKEELIKIVRILPKPDLLVVLDGGNFHRYTISKGSTSNSRVNKGEDHLNKWKKICAENDIELKKIIKKLDILKIHFNREALISADSCVAQVLKVLEDRLPAK